MTIHAALAALAGAMFALLIAPPHPQAVGAIALLVAVPAAIVFRAARAPVVALWFAATCIYCGSAVVHELAQRWPVERDGKRVLAVARIVSVPALKDYGWQFDAEIEPDTRFHLERIRVRVSGSTLPRAPRAGERWTLLLQLRAPRAPLNPGSPDMERQWFRERVHALGKVVRSDLNVRTAPAAPGIDPVREYIAHAIAERVADRDAAALFAALAVGVTGEVSPAQWRVFNATGITHLVAISGLHVTLFAAIAMFAARRAWRWWPGRPRVARDDFAAVAGIVAATGYTLLAGFSVPAQRTLIMLAAWIAASRMARAHAGLHAFATALVLVIAIDPFAPLSSGFWLSFVAVLTIILALGSRLAPEGVVRATLRTQLIVGITLVPVTLLWFDSVSLASLVVNLVAIPVFTLVLVPLVLAATAALFIAPGLAELALRCALAVHDLAWPALQAAAAWPMALVVFEPSIEWYALGLLAVIVAILPWRGAFRATAAVALLPALAVEPAQRPILTIAALDAGQGSSLVIRTRESVVLHGSPERFRSEGARSARLVVPALRTRGITSVDHVVLPRIGRDHVAGLAEVLMGASVGQVHVGAEWPGAILPHSRCERAPAWSSAGVSFTMLDIGLCTLHVEAQSGALVIASGVAIRGVLDHLDRAGTRIDLLAIDSLRPGDAQLAARMRQLGIRRVFELAGPRDAGPRLALARSSDKAELAAHGIALDSVWREGSSIELSLGDYGFSRARPLRERHRWPWRMGPV